MKQSLLLQALRVVADVAIGAALAGLMAYQGGATAKGATLTAGVIALKTLQSRLAPSPGQEQKAGTA